LFDVTTEMQHGLHSRILMLDLWLRIRCEIFSSCAWNDSRKWDGVLVQCQWNRSQLN